MVRIASYNVENLFERPKVFDTADWALGRPALDAYELVNELFQNPVYNDADKARMIELLLVLDIYFINGGRRPAEDYPRSPLGLAAKKSRRV